MGDRARDIRLSIEGRLDCVTDLVRRDEGELAIDEDIDVNVQGITVVYRDDPFDGDDAVDRGDDGGERVAPGGGRGRSEQERDVLSAEAETGDGDVDGDGDGQGRVEPCHL